MREHSVALLVTRRSELLAGAMWVVCRVAGSVVMDRVEFIWSLSDKCAVRPAGRSSDQRRSQTSATAVDRRRQANYAPKRNEAS